MRAALGSYARYWREAFRLPSMDLPAVAARLDKVFIGAEYFAAARRAGRGVAMALPHSGNWDMAGCGWRRTTAPSPRWPNGSSRSRSMTDSSSSGRAWGSRCCPPPAAVTVRRWRFSQNGCTRTSSSA